MIGADLATITAAVVLSATVSAPSPDGVEWSIADDEREPVELCRALESLRSGDRVPVIVRGVAFHGRLFDRKGETCRFYRENATCLEFPSDPPLSGELQDFHEDLWDAFYEVTLRGVLYGPIQSDPGEAASSATPQGYALSRVTSSPPRYSGCRGWYPTKFVIADVLSAKRVDDPESSGADRKPGNDRRPVPLTMDVPQYPPLAALTRYEGVAVVAITVRDGRVVDAKLQFGDVVIANAALRNARSWQFDENVSTRLEVEYEFRLERRPVGEGAEDRIELGLPDSVRVVAVEYWE